MQRIFITGTDTNVGKTYVSVLLLEKLRQLNLNTVALKPIASGAIQTQEGLRNEDALKLQQAASIALPYELVNPIVLTEAIAPHIAYERQFQSKLTLAILQQASASSLARNADWQIIEGAGGWFTPLNEKETLADFAAENQCEIILVVGLRLGCLNHAMLTAQAIRAKGCRLRAFVANRIDPDFLEWKENLEYLQDTLQAPCWGVIPQHGGVESLWEFN
jgi:dethiobiotin synthetase